MYCHALLPQWSYSLTFINLLSRHMYKARFCGQIDTRLIVQFSEREGFESIEKL